MVFGKDKLGRGLNQPCLIGLLSDYKKTSFKVEYCFKGGLFIVFYVSLE